MTVRKPTPSGRSFRTTIGEDRIKECMRTVAGRFYLAACAVDSYGHPVTSFTRHPKCRCTIPCQLTFPCHGRKHKGYREMPYCNGASHESEFLSELCDDCFCAVGETAA